MKASFTSSQTEVRKHNKPLFVLKKQTIQEFAPTIRKGFLRKKHSCSFIFSKLSDKPICLIHIFSIK